MGVDVQAKLRLALGSVKDHASIGKAMITNHDGFSNVEIAIVRATSHHNTPIHDTHMHEILFLVSNSSSSSVPFLAERISRRLARTRDRLVALKTLMLVHRLLRGGNRSFERQLRSAHLSGHLQISFTSLAFPSFGFLNNYARYLEERIGWAINQAGKLEPAASGQAEFRCYKADKSLDLAFRRLPKCQAFLDRVLACSPAKPEDTMMLSKNLLARAAMTNILKESFQVYATFCEGVATLVDMFLDLTKSARALACEILKRASRQSQELQDLYNTCKKIMNNKNLDYPFVQVITMDHVRALEQCLSYAPASSCRKTDTNDHRRPVLEDESRSDFSCALETKISMVWVVFEEKLDMGGSGTNDDNKVASFSGQGRVLDGQHVHEPCSLPINPFAACFDTRIVL